MLGGALAGVIAEVEGLGGTVTSVSGAGLAALFGAPEAHEDDPERAVRAGRAYWRRSTRAARDPPRSALGPRWCRDRPGGGRPIGAGDPLRSAGRGGGCRGGDRSRWPERAPSWSARATRAATEGLFEWGPTEEVAIPAGGEAACWLPISSAPGRARRARLPR